MKYHYVYRITNKVLNKHYYGVRTSKIEPKLDLGIKYFSSSTDEEFMKDQKENPQKYKYKIIKLYNNRTDAMNMEIKLHNKLDVSMNESFYNKAKQTSTGWSNYGNKEIAKKISEKAKGREPWNKNKTGLYKTSEETKKKISDAGKGRKAWNKGIPHSEEIKKKISENTKKNLNFDNEHRKKLSEKAKERWKDMPILICEYCGLESKNKGNMSRWHFENCKFKEKDKNEK